MNKFSRHTRGKGIMDTGRSLEELLSFVTVTHYAPRELR